MSRVSMGSHWIWEFSMKEELIDEKLLKLRSRLTSSKNPYDDPAWSSKYCQKVTDSNSLTSFHLKSEVIRNCLKVNWKENSLIHDWKYYYSPHATFHGSDKNKSFHAVKRPIITLTLSYTGGGKFAPDITNLSAISVPIALGSPKFMTLFHSMSDPS